MTMKTRETIIKAIGEVIFLGLMGAIAAYGITWCLGLLAHTISGS